jgi:hypothetical protein
MNVSVAVIATTEGDGVLTGGGRSSKMMEVAAEGFGGGCAAQSATRACSDGEGSTAHRGRFCGGSGRTRRRSGGSGNAGERRGMPTRCSLAGTDGTPSTATCTEDTSSAVTKARPGMVRRESRGSLHSARPCRGGFPDVDADETAPRRGPAR